MNQRASKLAPRCPGREGARPDSWGPSRPGTRRPSRPETRSHSTVRAPGLADGSRPKGVGPLTRPCPGTRVQVAGTRSAARTQRRSDFTAPHDGARPGVTDAETGHRTTEHSPTQSCRTVRTGGLADGSRRPVAPIRPDWRRHRRAEGRSSAGKRTGDRPFSSAAGVLGDRTAGIPTVLTAFTPCRRSDDEIQRSSRSSATRC